MKIKKGFIQTTLLIAIIAAILVLGIASYLGVNKYKNYQYKQIEKEKLTQDLLAKQQKTIEDTSKTIEALQAENKKAINKIKMDTSKKISDVQKKIEEDISKQQKVAGNIPTTLDLPTIIKQWRPRIAHIECTYKYQDGQIYQISGGSGILEKSSSPTSSSSYTNHSTRLILTNKHVVKDRDLYTPESCKVKFPDRAEIYSFKFEDIGYSNKSNIDFGTLWFLSPDQYILNLSENSIKKCSAEVGDKVLILGYPSYSNNADITVTEGIISGYESPYYTTSAKLEHGNSGGIAISVKDNCYIGIPSGAVVGEIESLGRILDYRFW